MKKKLSITMDSDINDKLDSYAKDNQKVKSQVIELAVSKYLEKEHKKMTEVEEYLKQFVDDMQEDKK
ncbi:ribbon-helix-helix domain-containing protein [Leuconostoc pseudomesenteroides]|uniref:ribbon-helix-helix domain-containing protein n=1 Tax=Leuconostoc pseudomesenteroides TaxID=33968 RepID=UPI0021A6B744|nr:ribbon-helix-helix domain-containing protein [Leuconostoc pseudomesenteroides]